tara:strand:- start:230 stop:919 length:690 start_codon:yes stop_codon:yes gene_type:complete
VTNFSIIIPVYNESKNIINLLIEIKKHLNNFQYEIVIVDDHSKDNTIEVINEYDDKIVKLIKHDVNLGQSQSILSGIKESKYNIIVTLDGDGQNNPKDISKLLDTYLRQKDIYLVGGIRRKRKDTIIKILSSKIANKIRSKILNDDCDDTGCSLKVFDKKAFLKLPFFDGIHRFLPALFKGFGYKTYFVYVDHRFRFSGKSNYGTFDRLFKGIKDLIKVKRIIRDAKYN